MNIRDIKRKKITEMTTDEILAERKFYEVTAFAAIVLPFACRVTLQSLCAATAFARMPAGRICSPCSLMTVTVLLTIINRSF